jgi:hypothetical protein
VLQHDEARLVAGALATPRNAPIPSASAQARSPTVRAKPWSRARPGRHVREVAGGGDVRGEVDEFARELDAFGGRLAPAHPVAHGLDPLVVRLDDQQLGTPWSRP